LELLILLRYKFIFFSHFIYFFFSKQKKIPIRKELGDGTEQDMYLVSKIGMLTNLRIMPMKIAL